jgi:hypothetical protein
MWLIELFFDLAAESLRRWTLAGAFVVAVVLAVFAGLWTKGSKYQVLAVAVAFAIGYAAAWHSFERIDRRWHRRRRP